jgi:hypothetical protein
MIPLFISPFPYKTLHPNRRINLCMFTYILHQPTTHPSFHSETDLSHFLIAGTPLLPPTCELSWLNNPMLCGINAFRLPHCFLLMCGMKGSTVTKRDPNTFIKIALQTQLPQNYITSYRQS